jgi:hypothetical protein
MRADKYTKIINKPPTKIKKIIKKSQLLFIVKKTKNIMGRV